MVFQLDDYGGSVGIAIGTIIILVILYLLTKRPANSPPNANVGYPIIGNYVELAQNPVNFVEKCFKKYGEVFTVKMMHKNLTFLIGPEASAPFFKLNDDFMSQNEVYGFMTPVFGKNVVYDAEPKKRTQQMQHMANGLRTQRLKGYIQKIENETNSDLKDASSQTNCSKIFCSWKSLIKIFALFILFISINLNYFSIAIGITTVIQINPYLMYLLSSCFEFVGVILCHLNDIIGRRKVNFHFL